MCEPPGREESSLATAWPSNQGGTGGWGERKPETHVGSKKESGEHLFVRFETKGDFSAVKGRKKYWLCKTFLD